MLWSAVKNQRSPNINAIFAFWTRTNDVLNSFSDIGGNRDSLCHGETAIAMHELLVCVSEGIALLSNLNSLKNAAVAKLL